MRRHLAIVAAIMFGTAVGAVVRVQVTPSAVTVAPGASVTFSARVTGGGNSRTVAWSLMEANCGTLAGARYTAPQTSVQMKCRVMAKHPTGAFGAAVVTVEPPPPPPNPEPEPPPSGLCTASGAGATRDEALATAIRNFELTCGVVYKSSPSHDCDPTNATQTAWLCSTETITAPPPEPEPTPDPEPTPTPPPACTGVEVPSGVDVVAFMQGFTGGTTYCFTAPTPYRLTRALVPKSGDVWLGPGVISGARVLSEFTFDGFRWSVGGQTAEGPVAGSCWPTHPRCNRPEELFVNDVRQKHVASVSAVGPGMWFFDYPADRVYLGTDPAGKRVELSVIPQATAGTASLVTIHGLTIEKFASGVQQGAIHGIGTTGWVVRDSIIQNNHGIGLRVGNAMQVLRNVIDHNGQLGIGGSGANMVIEGNTWSFNNAAGVNAYWEAGGSKFTFSRNLILRTNFAHHNDGPGIWVDIDNIDVLIEGNRAEDNALSGIFYEISYRGVIRRNTVRRNGTRKPDPGWIDGACILVANSSDVEVYENICEGNWQGITGLQSPRGSSATGLGPYNLTNLWVHDNQVDSRGLAQGSGASGIVQNAGTLEPFTVWNNRYDRNTYRLGTAARYFIWNNGHRTDAEWLAYGHDLNGTIIR